MPKPLLPAPEDVNAISRESWEDLRQRLTRADKLSAQQPLSMSNGPMGQILGFKPSPDHRPGIIVCPPAGKPSLSPPMAWVALARISNTEADSETALVRFEPYPPRSDLAMTVPAANLTAYHCGDADQFKPGTRVVLEWGLDLGSPPRRRYYFRAAEKAKCLPPCPPSSSSGSSGSSGDCPCFQVTFYGGEGNDQTVTLQSDGAGGFSDGNNFITTDNTTGDWVLGIQAAGEPGTLTLYNAPGGSDCPPTDVDAWTLQSGNLPLLSIEPCPSSSEGSSGGSSGGSSDHVRSCDNPLIDVTLDCDDSDPGFILTKYWCDGSVTTEQVPCCCGSSSSGSSGDGSSSGDGFTGDKTVIVDWDPDTCEVTKETWHFDNGRLTGVT